MSYFVPASAGFIAAVQDKTSARYYRVYIDIDADDVLEDVTDQVANNQISGGAVDGRGQGWQVVLRNVGGTYREGDFAGASCRIDAKCGDNEYITIFTGYVDRKGANRQMSHITDDKIVVKMWDYIKHSGTARKTGYYNLIGFTVCAPSATGASIFHKLALDMGITAGQVDVYATLDYQKDYLPLDGSKTAYKELQVLAGGYLGALNFRYDGKLRFNSPFMSGWTTPASEWTFDSDNIHALDGDGGQVLCNYVETEFDYYEALDARIIHKNLQLWNALFEYNEIEVDPGEYWPGGSVEGKIATLQYKDPSTGEPWDIGISIRTPTIGAYGAGTYDIECADGLLTLHSFNGVSGTNSALTTREPNGAQIILKNETGATIKIRKLTIWGQPLRILSKETIKDYDNSVEDWDIVEKKIDGKYLANDGQAYLTCKWWNEFGQVPRKRYSILTDWLPQIQVGAAVTVDLSATTYPPDGINDTFLVERYQHTAPNGAMGLTKTRLTILEQHPFSGAGSPSESRQVFSGLSAPESVDGIIEDINTRLTYTEAQEGYVEGGGTKTPTQATIQVCQAQGTKAVLIIWDQQLNLTNLDHYEIQVSDDNATWYALEFDGTDWKAALGATTSVQGTYLVHSGIPHAGTAEAPLGRQLYYRVRRVTKDAVSGDWSAAATATTNTVGSGDIAESAVFANNVVSNFLNSIFAVINEYLIVSGTEGFIGQTYIGGAPPYGAQRARLDQNELTIERYDGSEWVTVIKLGGDENGGFFPYIQSKGLLAVGATGTISELDIGDKVPDVDNNKLFTFDNTYVDQDAIDVWDTKDNLQFDATTKKFGTHALTQLGATGVLKDDDAQGILFNRPFVVDFYTHLTEVSGVSGLSEIFSLQTTGGESRGKEAGSSVFITGIVRDTDVCALDATAAVWTYYYNSGVHSARARLGIINGTSIVEGADILLSDEAGVSDIDVSIARLTAERAICFWGTSTLLGRYALISRSGSTGLTIDATGTVFDGGGDDCGYPVINRIANNKVLLAYRDVSINTYKCSIGVINASFTNASFYSGYAYASPGNVYRPCVDILNEQYFIAGQLSSIRVGELGTTAINYATGQALDTAVYDSKPVMLDATHVGFIYRSAMNHGNIYMKIATRSNRTLSFGARTTVDTAFGVGVLLPRLRKLSQFSIFLPYYTSTYAWRGAFFSIDATYAITMGNKFTFTENTSSVQPAGMCRISDRAAFIIHTRPADSYGVREVAVQKHTKASMNLGHNKLRFRIESAEDITTVSGDITTASGWSHASFNFDGGNALQFTLNSSNGALSFSGMTKCTAPTEMQFTLLPSTFKTFLDDLLVNATAQSPTYAESLEHYSRGEGWSFELDSQNDIIIVPKSDGRVNVISDLAANNLIGNDASNNLTIRCGVGGRIICDTQQDIENVGFLHMLDEDDRPSTFLVNGGSSATFADVDCSAYVPTGANGAKAILFWVRAYLIGNGSADLCAVHMRKKGSTTTTGAKVLTAETSYTNLPSGVTIRSSGHFKVFCDASGVSQYKISDGGSGQGRAYITLVGYYT